MNYEKSFEMFQDNIAIKAVATFENDTVGVEVYSKSTENTDYSKILIIPQTDLAVYYANINKINFYKTDGSFVKVYLTRLKTEQVVECIARYFAEKGIIMALTSINIA